MPHTFGMGTMGMRIEGNIIKINRCPFFHTPLPIVHLNGFDSGFAQIPSAYVIAGGLQWYGNIQWLG